MKKIILFFLAIISLSACNSKTAKIKVTNKVSNCRLESINFGNYRISGSPITNATSSEIEIRDKKNGFPKKNAITFYMVSKGNRVYLQTVEEFELKADGNLEVIIENNTELKAP